MAAANKPVWVQVAEAGFGDRLEELGWKQVSPAHWRLDGDGVIWRTLLGPAPKDVLRSMLFEDAHPDRFEEGALDRLMASCFEDGTGFELVGLDDLIRTVFPDEKFRWMYPMIRRNVKVHGPYSIWLEFHYASFYEAAERREANWSWWDSFKEWTGLFSPTHYDELEEFEPAARSKNSYNGGWWDTTELGVEEVAARLTRRWEAWIRPKVESGMTAQDLLSLPMYTRDNPDKTYNEDLDIYAHYIVGDLDYCRRRLRAAVNQKVPTLEEELAWLEEVDFFDKPIARGRSDKEKKETAQQFIENTARRVRQARKMARAFDLDLD